MRHFALFLANSISMLVLTMVLLSIYLEIFKAIKFQNVNQFRSIFTVFFVLQTRFIIYISNSRSLAPAAAAVTQKKLQQAFLLPILAGYCGVGEPWKIGDYLVSISGRPMLIVILMFLFLDNFYYFLLLVLFHSK